MSTLNLQKAYRLYDLPTKEDRLKLGLSPRWPNWRIAARPTGRCRHPMAGEWYLSGAEIQAYRAKVDFKAVGLGEYWIAELVAMEKNKKTGPWRVPKKKG